LNTLKLAYLRVVDWGNVSLLADLHARRHQALILNRTSRPREDIATRLADLEAYGAIVLANPDVVHRLQHGAPMNAADSTTFFGGDARGYTDYPAWV